MTMRRRRRAVVLGILAAALTLPGVAAAALPGTNIWVSVPDGFGPFPAQDVGPAGYDAALGSEADRVGVSADGRYVAFTSSSDALSPADDDRLQGVFVKDRQTGAVSLVSSTATGAGANGDSAEPSISDDGRYVAFVSVATNLHPADTNAQKDVFVKDLQTGAVELASRANTAGGAVGERYSQDPMISGNGAAVVFATASRNFAPGDTDDQMDVYRRFLSHAPVAANTTTLVSQNSAGTKGNVSSYQPSVNDNGSLVAFTSYATNLDDDTDTTADVFRRAPDAPGPGSTKLVSRFSGASGVNGNDDSTEPQISGTGDVVAFTSTATNLVAGDLNTTYDVFRRAITAATTEMVSVKTGGVQADDRSYFPAISDDGSRVMFITEADNLGAAGTDRLLVERAAGTTSTVSSGPGGTTGVQAIHSAYSETAGRVAFAATGTALGDGTDGYSPQVWVRDGAGNPQLVSRVAGDRPWKTRLGQSYANSESGGAVSADGRYVVFSTSDPDLVPGLDPLAGDTDIVRRDLLTGTTISVSAPPAGTPGERFALAPMISADGNRVGFLSSARFDPEDTDATTDYYVRDVTTGTTVLASRADGATGADPTGTIGDPQLSGDGRHVAFTSGDPMTSGESGVVRDGYVRDLATASTVVAARADGAAGALPDQDVQGLAISDDGTRVAFATPATNLGDALAGSTVFLRDLGAGTTRIVSRVDGANGAPITASRPIVSADGSVVAFRSIDSAALGAPIAGDTDRGVVRRVADGRTIVVGRADGADGAIADSDVAPLRLSRDGDAVLFASSAPNLTPGPAARRAYVRRIGAGTTELVARRDGSGGDPLRDQTTTLGLSADGDCAAFAARGDVPVPGISPDYTQVILRVLRRECPKDPPETTIGPSPAGIVRSATVTVGFTSDEANSTFECRAGGAAFVPCAGGFTRTALPDGPVTFEVRAIDPAGLVDPTPATRTVTVAVAPVVSGLSLTRSSFRVGPKATAVGAATRRPAVGTTLRLRSSEAGTARIAVERLLPGRRVGSSCRKPSKALAKRKRCTRVAKAGALRRTVNAGTSSVAFSGRVGRKALAVGTHRFTVTVTDRAGNASAPKSIGFKIKR